MAQHVTHHETAGNDGAGVWVPSMGASVSWLRGVNDPTVDLFLAVEVDGADPASCEGLVDAVVESERVQTVFSAQDDDGSWGPRHTEPRRRIPATLHTLHTLAVLGVGRHPATERAIEFLCDLAHSDDGVFSIDGNRDGVLSCYVGTAASAYLLCGARDVAKKQIDWLLRYQDVARGGVGLRVEAAERWGGYLRTRYGGCMADTTCLVGLAKVARALQLYARDQGDAAVQPLRASIREAFLDRRLMFDSNERVLPLGVVPSKASDWLLPTFPLDWHTDLIEVLDVVAHAGPFDSRIRPAVHSLVSWRLPDGSWPLRRSFWPKDVTVRERKSTNKGSPIVTLRAVSALRACQAAA